MLSLLNFKRTLYLISIAESFKSSLNIIFIIKSIIILKRNIINFLIKVVKTILIIILTTITIKEIMTIMIITMIIINSKTKKTAIEEITNLITKNVVIKIEILSNLLIIKGKS